MIPDRGKKRLYSPQRPDRVTGPPSVLTRGCQNLFPTVKQQGCEGALLRTSTRAGTGITTITLFSSIIYVPTHGQRPKSTTVQNDHWDIIRNTVLCRWFNFYISKYVMGKQMIHNSKAASIPQIKTAINFFANATLISCCHSFCLFILSNSPKMSAIFVLILFPAQPKSGSGFNWSSMDVSLTKNKNFKSTTANKFV